MIDITKKYRTRDDREVTGLRIRDGDAIYALAGEIDGELETWTIDGCFLQGRVDDCDLIEVVDVDAKLAELIAFRDAAIAKYPDLAPVDPIEAEVQRIYEELEWAVDTDKIRAALLRGIEIGKGAA